MVLQRDSGGVLHTCGRTHGERMQATARCADPEDYCERGPPQSRAPRVVRRSAAQRNRARKRWRAIGYGYLLARGEIAPPGLRCLDPDWEDEPVNFAHEDCFAPASPNTDRFEDSWFGVTENSIILLEEMPAAVVLGVVNVLETVLGQRDRDRENELYGAYLKIGFSEEGLGGEMDTEGSKSDVSDTDSEEAEALTNEIKRIVRRLLTQNMSEEDTVCAVLSTCVEQGVLAEPTTEQQLLELQDFVMDIIALTKGENG